jgi:hypothetical protein
MSRRNGEIEFAVEVFVRGHSAGRSRTFPYEVKCYAKAPGHTPGTAVAPILKEVASLAQAGCATPLHQLAVRASLTPCCDMAR